MDTVLYGKLTFSECVYPFKAKKKPSTNLFTWRAAPSFLGLPYLVYNIGSRYPAGHRFII